MQLLIGIALWVVIIGGMVGALPTDPIWTVIWGVCLAFAALHLFGAGIAAWLIWSRKR